MLSFAVSGTLLDTNQPTHPSEHLPNHTEATGSTATPSRAPGKGHQEDEDPQNTITNISSGSFRFEMVTTRSARRRYDLLAPLRDAANSCSVGRSPASRVVIQVIVHFNLSEAGTFQRAPKNHFQCFSELVRFCVTAKSGSFKAEEWRDMRSKKSKGLLCFSFRPKERHSSTLCFSFKPRPRWCWNSPVVLDLPCTSSPEPKTRPPMVCKRERKIDQEQLSWKDV